MGTSVRHHDDASFYCVKCANEGCEHLVPLLKYESEKLRRNPPEFQVKCPFCGQSNLYRDAEVNIPRLRRVERFASAKGFRNVDR